VCVSDHHRSVALNRYDSPVFMKGVCTHVPHSWGAPVAQKMGRQHRWWYGHGISSGAVVIMNDLERFDPVVCMCVYPYKSMLCTHVWSTRSARKIRTLVSALQQLSEQDACHRLPLRANYTASAVPGLSGGHSPHNRPRQGQCPVHTVS
jgi:hypothetical protein